jgi:hypothetical protein
MCTRVVSKFFIFCIILSLAALSGCIKEKPDNNITTPAPATSLATPEQTAQTQITVQPPELPKGTPDPDIIVDIYVPDKAWTGTTLFADLHKIESPRIIEVNMKGEIVWEYRIPENLKQYTNPGLDTERLPNNNILFVLPRKGVYEVNRNGTIVWSYLDPKVDHDADRLPNGNTLFVFGNNDWINDAQVKEVNPKGELVWTWYAKDHFDAPLDSGREGWTHTNAVTRLSNGNTLISLRNFGYMVEVDPKGAVVKTIGKGILSDQHDPEILPNGNILVAQPGKPAPSAIEIDQNNNKIVWEYVPEKVPHIRDADRLPNGNTLVVSAARIIEVTPDKEVVWQLTVKGITPTQGKVQPTYLYQAERINPK